MTSLKRNREQAWEKAPRILATPRWQNGIENRFGPQIKFSIRNLAQIVLLVPGPTDSWGKLLEAAKVRDRNC